MFQKVFHIPASAVDRHDRLKMSTILDYLQEIAGDHCALLSATRADLLKKNLKFGEKYAREDEELDY